MSAEAPPSVGLSLGLFFIGLSSWLLVCGVFAAAVWELEVSPEGKALLAHVDMAIQLGNVVTAGIVLFGMSEMITADKGRFLTGLLLALGVTTAVWLVFFAQLQVGGTSMGLLVAAVGAGVLGATSMVAFFPFAVSLAGSSGITSVSTGIGACGLVAQVLSWLSGGGKFLGGSKGYFTILLVVQLAGATTWFVYRRLILTKPEQNEALLSSKDYSFDAWAGRHAQGISKAGTGPLVAVAVSAMLQYAMPGLLPFVVPTGDGQALFWVTALWNTCTLPGRILGKTITRPLWLFNSVQAVILTAAIWYSFTEHVPPFASATLAVSIFSFLHGVVVTASFVQAGDAASAAYCGLSNQMGAWLGSVLALMLVTFGLVHKR